MKLETKAIVMGDMHCPFHDMTAIDAVLYYIRKTRPDVVVLNGDILDCYKASRFMVDPKSRSLLEEIEIGRGLLGHIDKLLPASCKLVWMDGNHEMRLKKYVWSRAPELDGLLTVPKLMEFKGMDIEYHEYGDIYQIGDVIIKHGNRYSSISGGYSVKKEMDAESSSIVMGHTHNLALIYRTYRGREAFGVETGHLSDVSQIDYLQDKGGTANWQQGFLELVIHDGDLFPIIHRVVDGVVI